MPLTPLPASNTKRYRMLYTVGSNLHSITSRCSDAQTDAAAANYFNIVVVAIKAWAGSNVNYVGVEVALSGSDVFNPISGFTPDAGTATAVSAVDGPRALGFAGRTSTGRKSKCFLYGAGSGYVFVASYEEEPITTVQLQGFQGLLNSQADFWLAIDGVKPIWYDRLTQKTNDHYIDQARV